MMLVKLWTAKGYSSTPRPCYCAATDSAVRIGSEVCGIMSDYFYSAGNYYNKGNYSEPPHVIAGLTRNPLRISRGLRLGGRNDEALKVSAVGY